MIAAASMNRILVIRGGAIGDFVLTLPAIKLLRDRFPKAHLEIHGNSKHAVLQLARPLAALRLSVTNPAAQFFPTDDDRKAIRALAGDLVFHPGSGSETKNWRVQNWIELGNVLLAKGRSLLVIAG